MGRIEFEGKKTLKDYAIGGIGTTRDTSKSVHYNEIVKPYAHKENKYIGKSQTSHKYKNSPLNQQDYEKTIKIWENTANNPAGVTTPINGNYHSSKTQIMVEPRPPMHFNLSFNVPRKAKALTDNMKPSDNILASKEEKLIDSTPKRTAN